MYVRLVTSSGKQTCFSLLSYQTNLDNISELSLGRTRMGLRKMTGNRRCLYVNHKTQLKKLFSWGLEFWGMCLFNFDYVIEKGKVKTFWANTILSRLTLSCSDCLSQIPNYIEISLFNEGPINGNWYSSLSCRYFDYNSGYLKTPFGYYFKLLNLPLIIPL